MVIKSAVGSTRFTPGDYLSKQDTGKSERCRIDWEKREQIWDKVLEEINELKEEVKKGTDGSRIGTWRRNVHRHIEALWN